MSSITISLLFKFGDEKHLRSLQNNGEIYMNTVKWFKNYEKNEEREDPDEGIISIQQVDKLKIKTPVGEEIIFSKDVGDITLLDAQIKGSPTTPLGNIYSLYSVYRYTNEKELSTEIDKRNTAFGDSFLIIYNVQEFLVRVFSKMNELGFNYQYGPVQYYNHMKYSGPLNIFYKPDRYEHQREFRIHVENTNEKSIKFSIGSIADISYLGEKKYFDTLRLEKGILK